LSNAYEGDFADDKASLPSRLGAWIGLEINLISFIPLISSKENIYTTEAGVING
jgi:hypothetical protein